ncbi:MAG: MFS transporter [Parachlamydiales bacterium]
MSGLLSLFQPAPHIKEIEDPKKVDSLYKYWRVRIFYSMFIGYALYYFTRKSFTFAMPGISQELHLDKAHLGLLGSIFYITYGVSKFASGIMSDRSNPRYFMAAGLFVTGVINILFGMSSSFTAFLIFWGINGWFQGFGWPPCARLLMHWYSHSERGAWWSSWNVSHNVGAFIIPWVVGAALEWYGWRAAMYIPGVICILGSFFLLNRLRDTPQSLGLPPIEKYRNDYLDKRHQLEEEQELTARQLLVDYVLKNPYIWILGIAYFFVYVVRTAVNDWTALYLIETKQYRMLGGNGVASLFEVGGVAGSICAGWASDKYFHAKRGPVNAIFAMAMIASTIFFWWIPPGYPWMDSLGVFFLGFATFGPQMLIGVAAAELTHKKAAATSTGFIGFIAYLGAAVAGYPLGKVAQEHGWDGFFIALIGCSVLATLILLPLWNVTRYHYVDEK